MNSFCQYALSTLLGFAASFIAWLFVARMFIPRIKISPKISKRIDPSDGNYKYRVKLYNKGCRDAFEFNVVAQIRFKKDDGNTQLMQIGINSVPLAYLEKKKGRTMNLKTEEIPEHHQRHLSPELRSRIQSGERVSLEEILNYFGPSAHIKVFVMCNDGVSGQRQYFVSTYKVEDIVERGFDPNSEKILSDGVI